MHGGVGGRVGNDRNEVFGGVEGFWRMHHEGPIKRIGEIWRGRSRVWRDWGEGEGVVRKVRWHVEEVLNRK